MGGRRLKIPNAIPPGTLKAFREAMKDLREHPAQNQGNQPLDKLKDFFYKVSNAINGGIEFGSPQDGPINVKGTWAQGTSPLVANTEFPITHNLGYIPTGFMVANTDQASHIYAGGTTWTTTQIFLKSDQAGVNYTIFIM
jgi:hypothetical protein